MAETIDVTPTNSGDGGSNSNTNITNNNERDVSGSTTITHVMYGMHAVAPFTLWTFAIIAMIIGVVKRDDVSGTWLDSHYAYMSRTFWWGLLWAIAAWAVFWVLGLLTLGIGMLVLWVLPVAVLVWYLYRVIRGWINLSEHKAIG